LKRWGVLGGSFDPVHLGHLWIALFALEQLDLDRVLLIPAAVPPHKGAGAVAPYDVRMEILRRAIEPHPGLAASDLEADAGSPSYTIDTLRRLRAKLDSRDEIWLLMGADSLEDLPSWREPGEILRIARLGIYGRPGHGRALPQGADAVWIDGPACGLSSTLIRERLYRGRPVAGLVPDAIVPALESSEIYRPRERRG